MSDSSLLKSKPPGAEPHCGPRALRIFKTWLLLAGLEGVGAALWLLLLPAEGGRLTGYSPARLGLAAAALLAALVFIAAARWYGSPAGEGASRRWLFALCKPPLTGLILFASLAAVFLSSQLIYLTLGMPDASVRAPLLRLLPLVAWVLALGVQSLIFLPLLRADIYACGWRDVRRELRPALIVFAVLLILWGFVLVSGLGVRPDVIGWHDPGAPLLPLQALAAWGAGMLLILFSFPFRKKTWIFDVLAALLIWGAAVWLWQAQPLTPNYFALRPVPPNQEYAPYSDASGYDLTAQRLAAGKGYGWMPLKPLYALFLGGLHAALGQDYGRVVNGQIVVLALFPVVLYFLGGLLHHRLTGLIAAGMVILRETNAIELSGVIRVAHAKLMLSDLPTAFLMALFCLAVAYWLLRARDSLGFPLLAGALLGALSLVRPQTMIFTPFVALFVFAVYIRRPRRAFLVAALLVLGAGLGFSGWLFRTWRLTGSPVLNDPAQTTYMTAVYHPAPNAENLYVNALQAEKGESGSAYNARIQKTVLDFVLGHPGETASFIAGHALHNEIESFLVLPMSPWVPQHLDSDLFPHWREQTARLWEACCSGRAYVAAQPFWRGWKGGLPPAAIAMLSVALFLFAAGTTASWRTGGAAALFPLLINLLYTLSSAVGRQSGWRFTLPADWVVFLFTAAGLVQVMLWLRRFFFDVDEIDDDRTRPSFRPPSGVRFSWSLGLALALCIGWAPVAAESLFPLRVDAFPSGDAWETAQQSEKQFIRAGLSLYEMKAAGLVADQGLVLYPRYYRAGQGEMASGAAAFAPRSYDRLGFTLLAENNIQAVLPLAEIPGKIPSAAAGLAIGCPNGAFLDVWALLIKDADVLLVRDPASGWTCPSGAEKDDS